MQNNNLPVKESDIKDKLEGRSVFITGADGFIGSHLAEKLIEFGAKVHVFVRATSSGMLHNLAHLREKIIIHRGDLADKQAITVALRALKSDGSTPVIFHLGAQAHVGESWNRPYETLATNVLGTINLLQSIVDLDMDVYKVDTAGSSEEYGNIAEEMIDSYRFDPNGGLILDERSPINPQSVYASAKVASDFLTRNFFKAYGVPGVVTRMFNNYGPKQNPRFITGTIITQALSKDIIHLGYVKSKRDFCFVRDGVMGHIQVALFGKPGDVYVYGYGKNLSMLEWYQKIIDIGRENGYWGEKVLQADTEERGRLGKSEVEELRVDYSKLNQLTGWKPMYSWDEGIRETIKWYAENRDKWIGRIDW